MLHRAARNAYSWWAASHIRTKQSKWLQQNLQDIEEKVHYIFRILDDDGDSFARRAEMYYRNRPELLNFVEDFFKSYKALAERFDYISKELQSANRSIATIYPERVQVDMDDYEDGESYLAAAAAGGGNGGPEKGNSAPKDLPAPPKMSIPDVVSMVTKKGKTTSRLMSKKGLLKFNGPGDQAGASPAASGLSKDEALQEIDALQKQILAMQTEREFVKSSYENGLAKYWDIENQVTELQARVSSLQDEFGIGTFIEDDEAQTLMASTALKSCQQTLDQLQKQQTQADEDAKTEHRKVQNAKLRFQSLVEQFEVSQLDRQQTPLAAAKEKSPVENFEECQLDTQPAAAREKSPVKPNQEPSKSENQQMEIPAEGRGDLESLSEKIKEEMQLSTSTHLTMSGLAENVDALVDKIVNLEGLVVAQNAHVNKLKAEANELHAHLQTTEEEKETLLKDSEKMSKKIRELEEQLHGVQNLNQTVNNQSNYIYKRITEASGRVDDLSGKLQSVLPDEGVKDTSSDKAANASGEKTDSKTQEQPNKREVTDIDRWSSVSGDQETTNNKFKKDGSVSVPSTGQTKGFQTCESKATAHSASAISGDEPVEEKQTKDGNKDHGIPQDLSTRGEQDESGTEDVEPNWKALFLNGLDERDKLLLEEYISVLRNYKESKRKLNEAEKKRRANHFQYVVQMKVLKNSIALKDAEIQSLRKKLKPLHGDHVETIKSNESTTKSGVEATDENTSKADHEDKVENKKSKHAHRRTLSELLDVPIPEDPPAKEEATSRVSLKLSSIEEFGDLKANSVDENHAFSTIEEKIRADIDELVEENMDFWLRFSTAFHQIGKFQSSVRDLQDELEKKKPSKQQLDNKPLEQLSEIRPIYNHLKEIQTELTLWLEHSVVLKDDLQNRLSSLCNLQEEITRYSQEVPKEEEKELLACQAAKLQGEILNMKRENKKVANELQAGDKRVEKLQEEIKTTIQELDEFGVKRESTNFNSRIPLRSFLFGVKLKKQRQRSSLFSCLKAPEELKECDPTLKILYLYSFTYAVKAMQEPIRCM
ncbi:PREDICTED: protein NETWORKED 2A-like [Ipomoea nil]|uniref:protein NETWORKED 2A-like n=1 Tax=Ipomoea nil TaxID=35883 RepID=UPI0009012712|nr:PREDICTED: protein NETWORKED 2A-like [Ipomoea nil]